MSAEEFQDIKKESVGDMGIPAQKAVKLFFETRGLGARDATPKEDAGVRREEDRFGPLKTIDEVIYRKNKKPWFAPQITTSTDSVGRARKISEMKIKPFIRLDEMKNTDTPIPRPVIFVDAKAVSEFLKDPDLEKHPELQTKILESTLSSLRFIKTQTKNPKEIKEAEEIIAWLEDEKAKISQKSKSAAA